MFYLSKVSTSEYITTNTGKVNVVVWLLRNQITFLLSCSKKCFWNTPKNNVKCMSKIRENSDHNEYFRVFCQFLKNKKIIIVCSLFIHILSRDIELFVDIYISSNQGCRKRNYQSRFLWWMSFSNVAQVQIPSIFFQV